GSGHGQGPDVVERPDAAPYRQGHEAALGDAGDDVEQSASAVGRSGDVVEDQLIGALQVVAHGQLDRVADVMQFAEFGAAELLTARGAPVVDVKAGDDASREHAGQDSSTSATVVTRGRVVPAHALTAGRGARGSRCGACAGRSRTARTSPARGPATRGPRSEEHTSELQSREK